MSPATLRIVLGLALGLVGVVIFGGTLPFTRLAVAGLDPWFVMTGRAAAAGCIAGVVLVCTMRRRPSPAHLGRLALISFCLVGVFPLATGLAMTTVEASHGGVVLGLLPLATAIAASVVARERLPAAFWAAALVGAAVVTAFALREGVDGVGAGDGYLALAAVGAALGYAWSGLAARDMPGWEVISWALVLALPVTIPASLLLMPAGPAAVPLSSWIGFAYVTLLSQYLGFFAWNTGLALGGIARVGQVQLLQVFVTLAIAAVLNGERVEPVTWVVAGMVVATVVVAARVRPAAKPGRGRTAPPAP
ncbi:DMT family transporter [Salinarimonas rosea]|uniref:DMT family transporter n=1 Tax=Salinarimonas rosea TaxID=552063 RepID=UPI000407B217|nr:DMT family transporter [Salinarimonas rosea]